MLKKRMHLKKKKKSHKNLWLIVIIVLLVIFLIKKYINVKPLIINYSEMEANKLATLIINTAIIEENLDSQIEEIYKVENGNITSIDYDTNKLNEILTRLTLKVQNCFGAIENNKIDEIGYKILQKYNYQNLKKGSIIYIPLGYLTGSSFLANYGPKIPIKIHLIGDVRTDIKTELKNYGLNNTLLKIYIHVEVVTQSIIPLVSNIQTTIVEYPIVLKVIQGEIPNYYLSNN